MGTGCVDETSCATRILGELNMRSRILHFVLLATTICLIVPNSTNADWHEFKHRCRLDWYRNNLWPDPFVAVDRVSTCSPFVAMAQNGWYQQCTLSAFHFSPTTQELTEAGKLKVRHIVKNHPVPYRTVFVLQALNEDGTMSRVDSVQQTVAQFTDGQSMPEVRMVSIDPPGKAADEVDAVNRLLRDTMLPPRLPQFQSTTSGGN
jgi:hypothetical protein